MSRARFTVAALWLAVASAAGAAVPHFDLERLTLDPSARGSLVVGDGEVQPAGSARLAVSLMLEHAPLVLEPGLLTGDGLDRTNVVARVVRTRATAAASLAVGVISRVEASLRVPLVWQDAADASALGGPTRPDRTGLGSPAAGLRVAVLSEDAGDGLSLALGGEVLLPVGSTAAIAGEEKVVFAPRVELGHRFGGWLLGGRVGGVIRQSGVPLGGGVSLGSEVNGAVVVATTGRPLRAELSAGGAWVSGDGGPTSFQSAEALAGLRYALGPAELFALGGTGLGNTPGLPRYRGLAGLAFSFGPGADSAQAPRQPAAPAPAPRTSRAAEPEWQPDPCWPGQQHTPAQCPELDDDGDGVPNGQDLCPLVPGLPELQGCPPKDTDGDGVWDHLDKCPTVPGPRENDGCPWPEKPPPRVEVPDRIYFDPGKAVLGRDARTVLDGVAALLKAHPEVERVRIHGHADEREAVPRRAPALSLARAEAVKRYLVKQGVAAVRLLTRGLGAAEPVEEDDSPEARAANRRVQFVVDGPGARAPR